MIDEKMLAKLRDSDSSDTSKVINLFKSIQATVKEKGSVEPYLISIGERATAIRDQYDERQVSTEAARQQLELLANESIEAEQAKKDIGLPDDTFTIYWELKRHLHKNPKTLAIALVEPFRRFPNFADNGDEMRQLKAELYKILLTVVQGKKMVEIADRLIKVRTP